MRFSVFPKFITPQKKKKTNKHAIQCSDGSITSDDDNSSISSSSSTNNNDSTSSTPKLHRKHNFPMLSTNKSSNTTQHQLRALPIHIQFAFGMFMKRPIYENWVYLVSLLRGEKLRQLEMGGGSSGGSSVGGSGGSSSALGKIEKSLADELTVFEAEDVHDEEQLDDEQLDDEEEKDSTMMKHDDVEEKQQQSNNNIGSSTTPTSSEIDIPETAAKTFIKRPSAGNWDLLVELFRKEKRQQQSTLLRKDQPHQVLRVESDLTFDEEHNDDDDDDTKTLSIIYESDEELEEEEEEDGESRNPAEEGVGEAHYEAYVSDEEVDEVLAEKEEEETNPSTTTTKKEEQSPFAEHELDWPWTDEEEAVLPPIVAAAASEEEEKAEEEEAAVQIMTEVAAAPTTLPAKKKPSSSSSSSPRIPAGFANTKARAYVLLWEKRCRRFDQSQVNVVQKSSLVPNNDDNDNAVVTDEVVVVVNSRKKNNVSPPLATTPTTTSTRTTKAAEGRDDEVNQYHQYYEENQSSLLSNDVMTHRAQTQSPAVVEEATNSVRDEVNYWENKMRNIHMDASYVLGR